ncbi:c-type cytochrome [Chitinophaga agrisoli]|uniref:C-type cytochrome n=1 Tax=Chitinophaga agrisoli TaxID=2607653 RepID=A0A5B2VYT9_9BACT|nr:cytochrome c peroxidase [Chitinophaga agrisoli]KAA2243376.1 c-type cytochrome [Chitinophaga agrisoli]
MKIKLLVFAAGLLFIAGVNTFSGLADNAFNTGDTVLFKTPENFPSPVYTFQGNPLTLNGFKLGRELFYDPILSKDRSISCANCHQQFAAFAQLDHPVSHGVDDCLGTRNTPALFNLAWQQEFMWDGGVNHIEVSPLNALTSDCEMANNLPEIVDRLKKSDKYIALFQQAFHTTDINSQLLLKALTQFTGTLISANAKYDKVMRHEEGAQFDSEEAAGYTLFKAKCAACHREPLFTDLSYRSNGLDTRSDDAGRDTITHQDADHGLFKVPSLRNVEVSGPYMHDGRFDNLAQVLEHYNAGMASPDNLDPLFKPATKPGITLSMQEQTQLTAFLKTLTDHEFLTDPAFQDTHKNNEQYE